MAAAARRAEREAERRHKQFVKQQMVAEAGDAVAEWQNHMREIVSLHVDPADDMDWNAMLRRPEPTEPRRSNARAAEAEAKLNGFEPRFWHAIVGGAEKRREKLRLAVNEARQEDDRQYQLALSDYQARHSEWRADVELSRRLLNGEIAAQRDVINEMQSLSTESLIGTRLSFEISDEFLHAVAHVHGDEVVPKVRRKQLQSGRLSESAMPAGEANELYQDYVCSVALRVAGDLLGLLPRDEVYVTCVTKMLDRATGHQKEAPILSVRFVRDTFKQLSLGRIDPSDSMRNFVHEMAFKRTSGFAPIAPLKPVD